MGQAAALLSRFSVYDLDNETATLGDDDFLGQLECTLGEVRVWRSERIEREEDVEGEDVEGEDVEE